MCKREKDPTLLAGSKGWRKGSGAAGSAWPLGSEESPGPKPARGQDLSPPPAWNWIQPMTAWITFAGGHSLRAQAASTWIRASGSPEQRVPSSQSHLLTLEPDGNRSAWCQVCVFDLSGFKFVVTYGHDQKLIHTRLRRPRSTSWPRLLDSPLSSQEESWVKGSREAERKQQAPERRALTLETVGAS